MDPIEETSPDGRLRVRFDLDHGRMSHEIRTPTIVETATGRTLLHIRQVAVDGRPIWRPGGFTLALRHYHYPDLSLALDVDLDRDLFRFEGRPSEEPLANLSDRVEEELRRQMQSADRSGRNRRRVALGRNAAVVLLGLAAVAAAVWLAGD
ncbi:MAG TPA: hypothetical protein VFO69_03230 [Allosphingosinicella sp.]|nr:hypothetical protein [Allosphingosinicella sp.]